MVWPVGSNSFGKAPVVALGPPPGSTGIPLLPLVLVLPPAPLVMPLPCPPNGASDGGGVVVAGARYGCIGGAIPGLDGTVDCDAAVGPAPP